MNFRGIALILSALILCINAISATDYYVATTGNDGNNGTISYPWLTIDHAADTVTAGDTVYVRNGTYAEQVWCCANNGTWTNWITFKSYPGEVATIDGDTVGDLGRDNGLFTVTESAYILVEDLRIIRSGYSALFARKSHNVIFRDNTIEDSWAAAIIMFGQAAWWSYNYTIDGNHVDGGHIGGDPMAHENLVVSEYVDVFEIKNNYITNSYVGLINSKNGVKNGKIYNNTCEAATWSCVYVDGYGLGAENIEVYNNTVFDMTAETESDICSGINIASEVGSYVHNISIYNNLIYNNSGSGFRTASYSTGTIDEINISSNTFVNNGNGYESQGGLYLEYAAATNVVVRNNIFSDNNAYQIRSDDGDATIEYNLIDGYRGYSGETRGTNYQEGDPGFVDPDNSDYSILSTSLAVDNGTSSSAPRFDRDGVLRPQNGYYDIGAYEYYIYGGGGPYGGTPWPIPGIIQAEDYDLGGEGVAYSDYEPANLGGEYRLSEGVDIEPEYDTYGYDVGWIRPDEWLTYTVDVAASGNYTMTARVASNEQGGTFYIQFNGSNITDVLTIPDTGGWQEWTNISQENILLTAGPHLMKILMLADGNISIGNINYLDFDLETELMANQTIVECDGWCYIAMNYTSKTLGQLDLLHSNDVVLGGYNPTTHRYILYRPVRSLNSGYTIEQGWGWTAYFSVPTNVTVTLPDSIPSINMKAGWNLVGHLSQSDTNISNILADIGMNATTGCYGSSCVGSTTVPAMGALMVYVSQDTVWDGS